MENHSTVSATYSSESRSWVLINAVIAFLVMQTFFLILYIISRIMNRTMKAWDVYFMLIAYTFQLGMAVIALVSVVYCGNGRHFSTLKPEVVGRWMKINFAVDFVYLYAVMFPKLSILCFYWRVFPLASYRYAVYAIQSVVVLTCITATITNVFICVPITYHWNPHILGGHCGNKVLFYRIISAPNLITDVCMLALPLYGIWHLRIKIEDKIGATIILMTGCIGILTAFTRLIIFIKLEWFPDVTWILITGMTWGFIEPAMYTIAGMLPSLAPLARYFWGDSHEKTLGAAVVRVLPCCGLLRKTSSNNYAASEAPCTVAAKRNEDLSGKDQHTVSFDSSSEDSSIDMV